MTAPTITWNRSNNTKYDDQGVVWFEVIMPGGTFPKVYGGWAEPSDQYGYYSAHYSCTPTSPSGHSNGNAPLVGSYLEYDSNTGNWAVMFGFANPTGAQLRAHMWTAV